MERKLLVFLLIAGSAIAEVTTTGDLIDGNQWIVEGSVLDHTYEGYLNGHVHTDWMGGSINQTIDLSQYTGLSELNYYTQVTACENRIGGHCGSGNLDTFTVTLTLDNGDTWTDTFYVGNSWEEIDLTYTPTSDANTAELGVYGVDNGFWGGWYGPVYYGGELTATYDPVPPPPPVAEDPVILTTALDSVLVPTVEVPVVEIPVIEPVEVAAPEPAPAASEQTVQAEVPAQSESPSQASTESPKGSAVSVVMANIDVASASMDDLPGDPANPVTQVLALAVMASQGVEIEDVVLVQPELPKGPAIRDNRKLAERIWWNAMVSDAKFNKYMVDAQWQN